MFSARARSLHDRRLIGNIILGLTLAGIAVIGLFLIRYEDELEQVCHLFSVALWLFAVAAMAVLWNRPKLRVENLFLLLGAGFGLFYIFVVTPLAAPDEGFHHLITFSQASSIVNGGWVADTAYLNYDGISIHNIYYETFLQLLNGLTTEGLNGQVEAFAGVSSNYPVQYLPQTVGTALALLLKLNRWWVYVLGDLTNLMFYLGITYVAIRRLPIGKAPMMIVALLPMSLHQAASFSSDAFINAMAFLFLAEVIRAIMGHGKLRWQELAALAVVGILLAPAKAVYGLLLLLLFFIPKERFGSRGLRWGYCVGVVAAALAAVAATYIGWFVERLGVVAEGEEAPSGYTIAWVLQHPIKTVEILGKTLVAAGMDFYLDTMVGYALAGLTMYINHGLVNAFVILMAVAAITGQPEEPALDNRRRIACLVIALLTVLAVMMTMLVGWTSSVSKVVEGVQGRYLLPIAPLVLLALHGRNFSAKKDMTRFYGGVVVLLQAATIMDILDFILLM